MRVNNYTCHHIHIFSLAIPHIHIRAHLSLYSLYTPVLAFADQPRGASLLGVARVRGPEH